MFDRTVINSAPTHKSVTVHEHKSPTDDAVKLLRDMERVARESVLKAVQVENNSFNAVVHTMRDHFSDKDNYAVIFKLNGKQLRVDHSANSWETMQEKAIAIRDAVAREIANSILAESIGKTLK